MQRRTKSSTTGSNDRPISLPIPRGWRERRHRTPQAARNKVKRDVAAEKASEDLSAVGAVTIARREIRLDDLAAPTGWIDPAQQVAGEVSRPRRVFRAFVVADGHVNAPMPQLDEPSPSVPGDAVVRPLWFRGDHTPSPSGFGCFQAAASLATTGL